MPIIRNLIIVVELSGNRVPVEEVDGSVTANELLIALAGKINLPHDTKGVLIRKATRKQILPYQSLSSAGVQDGETLFADFERTAGGGVPVRSFLDIQLIEAILTDPRQINLADEREKGIFAIFLYTREDNALASYIREYPLELHRMSGPCLFFVIEEPSQEWKIELRRYLGDLTGKYFQTVWNRIGVDAFRPYDASKAYEIAQKLKIKPDKLPCIVLFSRLQDDNATIVRISDYVDTASGEPEEFVRFFRSLFTQIELILESRNKDHISDLPSMMANTEHVLRINKDLTINEPIETIKLGTSLIEFMGAIVKLFVS